MAYIVFSIYTSIFIWVYIPCTAVWGHPQVRNPNDHFLVAPLLYIMGGCLVTIVGIFVELYREERRLRERVRERMVR